MNYKDLTKEELFDVINGNGGASRIPMLYGMWINPAVFGANRERAQELLDLYPSDAAVMGLAMPGIFDAPANAPDFRWVNKELHDQGAPVGLDAIVAIEDWEELDDVIARFPDPDYKALMPEPMPEDGRYRVAHWWYCFFERLWSLRGMENALTDFYLYPEEVHRFFDTLADFYCRVIERCRYELNADAVFTSDDIGTQTGPFFSKEIFDEFFKPYYKRLIDKAHSLGMHFWLHTCGNVEMYIPDLIEIGLDVIHPIQKHTMAEKDIAARFGDRVCIWGGFDVQQTIPYGTPQEVREEVRSLIDTYSRRDGRFMLTLGNGATSDTPIESLEALLNESYNYGIQKCVSLG